MAKASKVMCKNIFKNLDNKSIAKEYNLRWLNVINKLEKNKVRHTSVQE